MGVKLHEGSELVLFKDMVKGDIGVIERSRFSSNIGSIVFRPCASEDRIVSLSGDSAWDAVGSMTEKVRLLPKGTLLEVT